MWFEVWGGQPSLQREGTWLCQQLSVVRPRTILMCIWSGSWQGGSGFSLQLSCAERRLLGMEVVHTIQCQEGDGIVSRFPSP